MRFPLVVFKEENSDYGGLLPDFPGCYPMGETLDALLDNVQDAIETWMLGEEPELFPAPSSLEEAQHREEVQGGTLLLVDVDTAFLDSATQRVNITMPRYALSFIDKKAKIHGLTRSAFLVQAAQAYV